MVEELVEELKVEEMMIVFFSLIVKVCYSNEEKRKLEEVGGKKMDCVLLKWSEKNREELYFS